MSPRNDVVVDLSHWPIVICHYPDPFGVEQLEPFFAWTRTLFEQNTPYVMITDLTRSATPADGAARHLATDFAREAAERSADLCRHAIQLVSSRMVRLALQAITALERPPYPVSTVETWEDALRLAQAALPTIEVIGPPPSPYVAADWRPEHRSAGT